jgi:hypothetical protein
MTETPAAVGRVGIGEYLAVYDQFRDYVKHEDELINARISRTLLLHGFLLAAYGLLLQAVTSVLSKPLGIDSNRCDGINFNGCATPQLQDVILLTNNLTTLIAILGVISAIGSILGVTAAKNAIDRLDDTYKAFATEYAEIAKALMLPTLTGGGDQQNSTRGYWAAYFLPWTTFAMWILILVNTVNPKTFQSWGSRVGDYYYSATC